MSSKSAYGFVQDKWDQLRLGVREAVETYQKALDEAPHDTDEEEMIFDALVIDLFKVFQRAVL